MTWILGLGGSNHDFSSTLLHNGEPHTLIEDERITGIRYGDKRWTSDPCSLSSRFCLDNAKININDVDGIFLSNDIESNTKFWENKNYHVVGHHLCHASSAFYTSPFEKAAIMVIDGRGGPLTSIYNGKRQFETISFGLGSKSEVNIEPVQVGSQNVSTSTWSYISSNSLGHFYSIITEAIGMGVNGEGKTMALAAFGKPIYVDELKEFVKIDGQSYFEMNPYAGIWTFLLEKINKSPRSFSLRADLAASAQTILEEVVVYCAKKLRKQTKERFLAFGGGVALNGVANHLIREKSGFENLFVFPASGDNGLSTGAALYGHHHIGKSPVTKRSLERSVSFAFSGKIYSEEDVYNAAKAASVALDKKDSLASKVELLVSKLLEGNVIGCFQGASEFGPRALGNRSLIALPSLPGIQKRMNQIKHRESFRPFAPIVLEEELENYFDMSVPSPFMLEMAFVRPEYRTKLAGSLHVDGSARIQTIGTYQKGLIRETLLALKRCGLPPVILNTSFNMKGHPIVETPNNAVEAFVNLDIDGLLLENYWLEKHTQLYTPENY